LTICNIYFEIKCDGCQESTRVSEAILSVRIEELVFDLGWYSRFKPLSSVRVHYCPNCLKAGRAR
jgi:hypothetical protein